MKQWHLIQFKPNAYRVAEKNLKRQGFETFLPLQETTQRNASRFTKGLKPLFPGYMFVSVAKKFTVWDKINNTVGVSRVVSFDGRPTALPDQLVNAIKMRCDTYGKLLPLKYLKTGDTVELLTGPFANFIASVEAIESSQRIWVVMEFMGQCTRMGVPLKQLRITN